MRYYSTQAHFERLFAETWRPWSLRAGTEAELAAWQRGLRQKLSELIGFSTMTRCDPAPKVLEEVPCQGYTRRKMTIFTEPDVEMPFYLLMPDGAGSQSPRAAVLAMHGHASNGKEAVAGVRSSERMAATIDHYHYNYGEVLAQQGYLVLAPDARGFGERRERYQQGDDHCMESSCQYLNAIAISLGQSVTGMWAWDLMRLADFALTLDGCDGRLGSVGLSGGGLQSLWFSALDERVGCSVVSGYFYGYLQSLLTELCCACNYVPGLWENVDIGDIGALIAPRPLLIETGDADDLNGRDNLGNVIPQVDTVRRAMALCGAEDNLYHDIFQGEHRWNGVQAFPWMQKHLPPQKEGQAR